MEEGYIWLYRKLKKAPYYQDSQYVHLWLHILLSANHSPTRIKVRNSDTFIDLSPGQFITSRDALQKQTGLNSSKVERILKSLENEQQIEQQTTSKYRIISITNWHEYQKVNSTLNNKRTASEQQVNTNNNDKNENKKDRAKSNFVPPSLEEVKSYCQERCNGVDYNKWHNFYTAKNWMIGTSKMKDWRAAVRTWEDSKIITPTARLAH